MLSFSSHVVSYRVDKVIIIVDMYWLQVCDALETYKNSADLTVEPPITSYDINILKSIYEREKQGWVAHSQKTGHLVWTLVPESFGDYKIGRAHV